MSMRRAPGLPFLAAGLLAWSAAAVGDDERFGFGTEATEEQMAGWDIDVPPSGEGLPQGSGTVTEGEKVYTAKCVACHGEEGQGKPMDKLVGGRGTLASDAPVKTVGSYWPYATTLYDYVHRTMPFNNPQSLTPNEVYAVSAYILHLNEIVPADAVMDQESLPAVKMPNRDGFYPDPRPDVWNTPCLDCE